MTVKGIRVWGMIVLVAFSLGCGILWLSFREPVSDVTPETSTVRIGLVSSVNQSQQGHVFLAELAREEINEHCEEIGSGFRFEFVYNCADASAPNASRSRSGTRRKTSSWSWGTNGVRTFTPR
ncbi:MAG: hypothetical protein NWF12_02010 [Candidatus Bathyarchaeota archaeon]|nr:hypothetical protein [Candidatus Bathyarchaeota archaeon]